MFLILEFSVKTNSVFFVSVSFFRISDFQIEFQME